MTITCIKCNEDKDESEFAKGHGAVCKSCYNAYTREYRKNNPEKMAKYSEKYKASQKAYRIKNKEYLKEYHHEHYLRTTTPEKRNAYYASHKEEKAIYRKKQYAETSWAQRTIYSLRGRAKKLNVPFDLDAEFIESLIPVDGLCPLLNTPMINNVGILADDSMSIDRIDSNRGYVKDNIQVLSNRANSAKRNLTYEEFQLMADNWRKQIEAVNNIE